MVGRYHPFGIVRSVSVGSVSVGRIGLSIAAGMDLSILVGRYRPVTVCRYWSVGIGLSVSVGISVLIRRYRSVATPSHTSNAPAFRVVVGAITRSVPDQRLGAGRHGTLIIVVSFPPIRSGSTRDDYTRRGPTGRGRGRCSVRLRAIDGCSSRVDTVEDTGAVVLAC